MRGGIAGQMPSVQAVAGTELDEIRHGSSPKMRSRRSSVFPRIHIRLHDPPIPVHVIAIQAGTMIAVFADNPKLTPWGSIPLPSRRYPAHGHFLPAFVEVSALLAEAHDDRGTAGLSVRDVRSDKIGHRVAPPCGAKHPNGCEELEKSMHGSEQMCAEHASRSEISQDLCVHSNSAGWVHAGVVEESLNRRHQQRDAILLRTP